MLTHLGRITPVCKRTWSLSDKYNDLAAVIPYATQKYNFYSTSTQTAQRSYFLAGLQSIWSYVTNTSRLWLKFPKYDITEPETDLTPRWAISLVDIRRGFF